MKTIYLAAIIVLSSCSVFLNDAKLARHHIRKAEKHIKKAEDLGAEWKTDTVFQWIEVPVPEVQIDTQFITKPVDTVYLTQERLSIKVVRSYDTIRIEGTCLPDTILVNVPAVTNKTLDCPDCPKKKVPLGIWILIGALVLAVLGALFKG